MSGAAELKKRKRKAIRKQQYGQRDSFVNIIGQSEQFRTAANLSVIATILLVKLGSG